MNILRQVIESEDRKFSALARRLDVTREGLRYKIDNDIFTDDQRQIAAEWLGRPIAELFPGSEPVTQEVEQA